MANTNKLDLVLINPSSRTHVYQSLGESLTAIENPVWAGLMATFCRTRGLSVELIDAEAEELNADQVAERVQHLNPVLAVVVVYGHQPSASTQIMTASGQVCTAIKRLNPEQKILFAGGHVAALPEQTLHEEDADFVAAGEGLHGLSRKPYAALYTTLGCPYHCSFCCIQAPFKSGERAAGVKETTNSYRYWSPDNVIEQIDVLVNKYGVRNIKIADEMFVLNRKHVLGICDRIIARGYDLNIWAYTRVDTVKDGMLDKLKAAGVNWLAFGIEAGADRVRDNVDKSFDQQEVYEVLRRVHDAGINVIGNYIFGLPEDDLETMQATLDLALDLRCEFANFYSAMAYPGSPLYTRAVRQGVPLPQKWTGYSQHSRDCLPMPTRYIPAREVLRFRDSAFLKYYSDPQYLDIVERRFGSVTVAHLREMTAHKLERHLLDGRLDVPPVLLPAESSPTSETPQLIPLSIRSTSKPLSQSA
jgi:radical SAM superfamily enzyme YgiQ (UPF0313 family)